MTRKYRVAMVTAADAGCHIFLGKPLAATLHDADTIQCEQATVCLRTRGEVFVYPGPVIEPENDRRAWAKVWVEDWHFTKEHKPAPLNDYILRGNQTLVRELVSAIEHDTEPTASLRDAVLVTEIIQGAYASHFAGGMRLAIPLTDRRHPLV